jgi:antitoxin YefM
MNLSASEARAKLFPLIEELNAGGDPVLISSKAGNAVLLSESEYNGLLESLYIFSNPENLLSINQSIAELKRGEGFTYSPPKAGAPATFAPRKAPKQVSAAKRSPKLAGKKKVNNKAAK